MLRPRLRPLAVLAAGAVSAALLGACGGGGGPDASGGATTAATSAPTIAGSDAAPSGPAGPAASTAVTVPGSGTYTLKVQADTGPGPCKEPAPGRAVPFTVAVTNTSAAPEPLARVAVAVTDPKATGNGPVAAISFQGICLNFTEPGGTLAPGQTMTYDGTASGVSSAASLTATVISTPDNSTLAQVSTPLG